MAFEYTYDSSTNIIMTQATGVITASDLKEYVNSVIDDKNIQKGFIECVNFENIENLIISYTDTSIFSGLWDEYINNECKSTIIVAPTDIAYGCCRMIQAVIELNHENTTPKFLVVRSNDELRSALNKLNV